MAENTICDATQARCKTELLAHFGDSFSDELWIGNIAEGVKKLVSQRYHAAWNPCEDTAVEGTYMLVTYWLNGGEF